GLTDPIGATPVAPLGDLFVATPLGPGAVGLGISVPYAAVLAYPDDGPQRFALQRTSLLVGQLSLGAAVATGPLAVGATVDAVLGSGSLARVQDFAGLEFFSDVVGDPPLSQPNDFGRAAPSSVREQDVLGRDIALRGLAVHATFGVGMALDLGRSRLAASYAHGSPVVFRGRFALDLDDPVFTNDLVPFGLQYPPQAEGDSAFSVATPRRLRLGLATALDDEHQLRLTLTGSDWTRYDATEIELVSPELAQPSLGLSDTVTARVPRRWQPTLGVEAALRLRRSLVAVGYASPASPDDTVDVASIDGHRLVLRGGGELSLSDTATLWVGGKVQGLLPRTVTTSGHDLANGRYDLVLASLSTHLTLARR
ncbi:MAG: hypothetical protein AAF602_15610, partial [Myxococcota bacterium]